MRLYELTYLISPNLPDQDQRNIFDKVISFIQENEGIFKDSKIIPKQNLISLIFYSRPEKIGEIEKKIKLESKIIRQMILVKKNPKIKSRAPRRLPASPKLPTTVRPLSPHSTQKKPEEKVELKDIEKKLEEILGK